MKRSPQAVAVILNQDVENVGFKGELITVKAGYARNFLMRDGRGEIATPVRQKLREAEMAEAANRREKEMGSIRELATKISATPLELSLKTGLNNQVFGSISAADIVKKLQEVHELTVKTSNVAGVPIKALGHTTVAVKLGIGITADVPVVIKAQKAPAERAEDVDAVAATEETASRDQPARSDDPDQDTTA